MTGQWSSEDGRVRLYCGALAAAALPLLIGVPLEPSLVVDTVEMDTSTDPELP